MIARPAGAPGLEQDLAAAAARESELKLAQIAEEVRRLETQAYAASSWQQTGYAMGCATAGGCSRSGASSLGTGTAAYAPTPRRSYESPTMAP
jgi:hypothetical protein